jgi:hypothetical protein
VWEFISYREEEETDESLIKGGDLITLKHSEQGGYLSADFD